MRSNPAAPSRRMWAEKDRRRREQRRDIESGSGKPGTALPSASAAALDATDDEPETNEENDE